MSNTVLKVHADQLRAARAFLQGSIDGVGKVSVDSIVANAALGGDNSEGQQAVKTNTPQLKLDMVQTKMVAALKPMIAAIDKFLATHTEIDQTAATATDQVGKEIPNPTNPGGPNITVQPGGNTPEGLVRT